MKQIQTPTSDIPDAEYLVVLGTEAGVMLCQRHAETFELIMRAGATDFQVVDISEEPEVSRCQACHLAAHPARQH